MGKLDDYWKQNHRFFLDKWIVFQDPTNQRIRLGKIIGCEYIGSKNQWQLPDFEFEVVTRLGDALIVTDLNHTKGIYNEHEHAKARWECANYPRVALSRNSAPEQTDTGL